MGARRVTLERGTAFAPLATVERAQASAGSPSSRKIRIEEMGAGVRPAETRAALISETALSPQSAPTVRGDPSGDVFKRYKTKRIFCMFVVRMNLFCC